MTATSEPDSHPSIESPIPSTLPPVTVKRGAPCPKCGQAALDYNGLLELECPVCGFSTSAGAGCT